MTCRTVNEQFLLTPDHGFNDIVVGVIARAKRLYPLKLCGLKVLSDHYHLLAYVEDARVLARFMWYLNGNLAKEVDRKRGRRGAVWWPLRRTACGTGSIVLQVAPMAAAGIRELRQRASELLGRVARGETIEITDRGRAVALLSPLPEGSRLDQLRAAGEIEPATGVLEDLPEPLDLAPGVEPPSEVLARLRRDER